MRRRHDAQRQHIVDSLDNLVFQLYTLSFFLSPAFLPLLCRLATHFVFYKPRELDPKLSLRVWLLVLVLANAPSFWSHITDAPAQGRAVVLDFVGIGYLPSKLHLVLLDTLILSLQILLTTISFEVSLRLSSPSDPSPALFPPLEMDPNDDDDRKYSHHHTPTMIVDLRFRHLVNRLRHPVPLASRVELPLPNTTPSPTSVHRAIVRRADEARRRVSGQSDSAEAVDSPDAARMPGGMSTEQVE